MRHDNTSNDEAIADADLVLRTRSGDAAAFGELWRRHYPSGMSVARSVTSSIDPDDLVQESYTRIYQAIIKGGGPNGSFRAYLFTSIRNTAAAWGRSRRESAIDELDTVADPDSTEQAANEALDRSLTAQAFRSLPSRWQEVLWYTEIEQMKPAETGALLGMKAGAVSQLAFRAREGLREAWIQAHLRSAEDGSDCQWTIEHLGAYSRGNLSTRDHKRLEAHIEDCARCMIVAAEAKDVSKRLVLVLLPLVLGVAGSTGYLATLQGGGAPVVALAAMPSSVTQGAVLVGGASTAGAGASGGAGGASGGAGGAGGAGGGAGAAGGVFSGVGALVGVGSAAIVVAGVVAAATVLPGLAGANPAASLPSAGDSDSSSISSDVGPDASMSADKPVTTVTPEPVPVTPPVESPETPDPAEDTAPEISAPAATAPVAPTPPVDPAPPVDPGTDPVDPGTDPGTEPGDGEETTDPGVPAGAPAFGTAWYEIVIGLPDVFISASYVVPVSGAAGSSVGMTMDREVVSTGTSLVAGDDATGRASIALSPTLQQVCSDATVQTYYVSEDGSPSGTTATSTLSQLSGYDASFLCSMLLGDAPAAEPAPVETADPAEPAQPAAVETEDAAPAAPVDAPAETLVDAPAPEPAPVETTPVIEPAPVQETAPAPEAATVPEGVEKPFEIVDPAGPGRG